MTSSTLRQVWSVIEETHASLLLKLSDAELLQQLLIQLADKKQLNIEEVCDVRAYIPVSSLWEKKILKLALCLDQASILTNQDSNCETEPQM